MHVARFTCPWQTFFAASDVYFCVWSGYPARNFIQSNVSIQVACGNLICGETSLKVGSITRNITRLSNASKILHIFVLPVYRSLKVREFVKSCSLLLLRSTLASPLTFPTEAMLLQGRKTENCEIQTFLRMLILETKGIIVTNEIPSELSCENLISSHVKITCYPHMWKYHHCYGFIINRTFQTKKLFK